MLCVHTPKVLLGVTRCAIALVVANFVLLKAACADDELM